MKAKGEESMGMEGSQKKGGQRRKAERRNWGKEWPFWLQVSYDDERAQMQKWSSHYTPVAILASGVI